MKHRRPSRPGLGMFWLFATAILAVFAAGSAAVACMPAQPARFDVMGSATLGAGDWVATDVDPLCAGSGRYDGVRAGAPVQVFTAGGELAAGGQLQPGAQVSGLCIFVFVVRDVPVGGGPYAVDVTGHSRITFQESWLRANPAALGIPTS